MSNYVPQLNAFSPDNLYTSAYYSGTTGGYYALPNCTRYCYGRWWSLIGSQPSGLANLGNGEDWYNNCTAYSKGMVPKLGAIACFADGPYSGLGHVAVVERIYNDGKVLFSNSAYKGSMFYLRCGSPGQNYHDGGHNQPGYESAYAFQGFIYCPIDFDPEIDPGPDPPYNPDDPGYRAAPLVRWMGKKKLIWNGGRFIE